jgi:DNA-binding Xre family transcriptional regulator
MNVEERLKELIIKQYGTMKDFTDHIGIPNSTFANILRRGVQNANVLTIIKICQALEISTDDLAQGKIVPLKREKTPKTKIEDIFDDVKQQLLNAQNLTIDDEPATADEIMFLVNTLDVALQINKKQRMIKKG